jgi:hypothetical protein
MAPLWLMTKREKTWFFPFCGYQPKINELIFLIIIPDILAERVRPRFVNSLRGATWLPFFMAIRPAPCLSSH